MSQPPAPDGVAPSEPDGAAAAREVLLLMAEADAHWGDYDSAIRLLDSAERAVGGLPAEYSLKRRRWLRLRELRSRGAVALPGRPA